MRKTVLFSVLGAAAWALAGSGFLRAADTDKSTLNVIVPRYADVWVMGEKSKQTGSEREFVTPELFNDRIYDYDIRARWIDSDGRVHDETRSIPVRAGHEVRINFMRPAPAWQRVVIDRGAPARPAHTSFYRELPARREDRMISDRAAVIRVKVPAEAQVFLSGEQTAQGGTLREFVTRDLEAGKNYTAEVQARWKEHGLEVAQTRKVQLHPGDRVTVDFTMPPEKNPTTAP